MQTVTQFLLHPDDIKTMFIEVLKQASGNAPTGHAAIPVEELPLFSAQQAADYLGCADSTLKKIVQRYPDKLRPIIIKSMVRGQEKLSAIKYDPKELYYIKSNNLVK
jgi:hypothetical protein